MRYWFIYHLKDLNTSGELESPHVHIVAEYKQRKRLSTFLNEICKCFEYDSPFGIEIDNAKYLECCIQYLIHKNDKEKTPHDISEIITNITREELDIIVNSDNGYITLDYLVQVISRNHNKLGIMDEIGLNNYIRYRLVILDIIHDINYIIREDYSQE